MALGFDDFADRMKHFLRMVFGGVQPDILQECLNDLNFIQGIRYLLIMEDVFYRENSASPRR